MNEFENETKQNMKIKMKNMQTNETQHIGRRGERTMKMHKQKMKIKRMKR